MYNEQTSHHPSKLVPPPTHQNSEYEALSSPMKQPLRPIHLNTPQRGQLPSDQSSENAFYYQSISASKKPNPHGADKTPRQPTVRFGSDFKSPILARKHKSSLVSAITQNEGQQGEPMSSGGKFDQMMRKGLDSNTNFLLQSESSNSTGLQRFFTDQKQMLSSARGSNANAYPAQAHFFLNDGDNLLKRIGEEPFEGADSFAEDNLRVPKQLVAQATKMIGPICEGSDSNELLNIIDVDNRSGESSVELGEYSSMLTLQQHPKQQSPIISCSREAKNLLSQSAVSGTAAHPQFAGDRFIPCRPGDQCAEGAERFLHEQNQLLGNDLFAKNSKRRNRANSNLSDADSQNSASQQSSNSSNNSQQSSNDSQSSQQIKAKQHETYTRLLQEQCFGVSRCDEGKGTQAGAMQNLTDVHVEPDSVMGYVTAQKLKQQASAEAGTKNKRILQPSKGKKATILKYKNTHCYSNMGKANSIVNLWDSQNQENRLPHALVSLGSEGAIQDGQDDENFKLKNRKVCKLPFKVLDAPMLQDDFYLNLLDWSSQNVLAVGLMNSVYIWSAQTSQVKKLCEFDRDDAVTSVGWSQVGNNLAVGTHRGRTQIYDAEKLSLIRTFDGHTSRVSSVAWNQQIVSTGSRDHTIINHDMRQRQSISHFVGHKQEVCGLKWSFDNMQLASGGNDNKLMIWSMSYLQPQAKFTQHKAAVKAIGWSPRQRGLLATGGGTADRHIRFWNTHTLQPLHSVDTGSQVCNLMFSKNSQELVSTHGYSFNQIILWKFPTMKKIQTLTGHTQRVLYLGMSPCGENVVTGAGDETLRFWTVFPNQKKQSKVSQLAPASMIIR